MIGIHGWDPAHARRILATLSSTARLTDAATVIVTTSWPTCALLAVDGDPAGAVAERHNIVPVHSGCSRFYRSFARDAGGARCTSSAGAPLLTDTAGCDANGPISRDRSDGAAAGSAISPAAQIVFFGLLLPATTTGGQRYSAWLGRRAGSAHPRHVLIVGRSRGGAAASAVAIVGPNGPVSSAPATTG